MRDDLGSSDASLRRLYLNSLLNGSMCYLLGGVMLACVVLFVLGKLQAIERWWDPPAPPPPLARKLSLG